MTILRLPFKLVALPVALAVTIAKWVGVFLTSFAGVLFYILSGLCFVLAVLSYLMDIQTSAEAIRMLAIGFVAFILPFVAGWVIGVVDALSDSLWDFIRS
ncbi:MAG: CD1845 family protein [Oscillospiraceae bacterium]|nr:CD1845 family protein [Oscillospiraceae bacterium]